MNNYFFVVLFLTTLERWREIFPYIIPCEIYKRTYVRYNTRFIFVW